MDKKIILTPEYGTRLVAREAVESLREKGMDVATRPDHFFTGMDVTRLFARAPERSGLAAHPDLFFTVNFHGLDRDGEAFAALEDKGVPVAVWCVDNPWNQLSGLRSDFWKRAWLFVTDDSFIPGLEEHGAEHVFHLPLGACRNFHCAGDTYPDTPPPRLAGLAPMVFVGRSAFPDKGRFFVGQSVDAGLLAEAEELLKKGARPDFFWWLEKLAASEGGTRALWPGSFVRRVSLGAEESAAAWRKECLESLPAMDLTIFGDAGWDSLLASEMDVRRDLRGPVDYYEELPRVYRDAEFSLNMTSLLLPRGLTQRHFDVWTAGGFLLTDKTPGLDIFPGELHEPVRFEHPSEIAVKMEYFRRNPLEKHRLAFSWRKELNVNHGYERRVEALLRTVFG